MPLSISKTSEWRAGAAVILDSCLKKAPWNCTPKSCKKLPDKCRNHINISIFPEGKCCNLGMKSTRLWGSRKSMQGSHRKLLCMASAAQGIIHFNSCSSLDPNGEVGLAISSSLYPLCKCWFLTNSFPSSPPAPGILAEGLLWLQLWMHSWSEARQGSTTYRLVLPKTSVGTT